MSKIFKIFILLLMTLAILPVAFAQNPFLDMIQDLRSIGIFDIFIFILFFITFYAILAKSKVLGDNVGLNGTIALIAAFLISIYSTFTSFSLVEPLSRFFTQLSVVLLLFIAAFIFASFFYPDLPKMLSEHIKGPIILYILIPLAIALLITSRSIWVLWAGFKATPGSSTDIIILAVSLIIFVVILLVTVVVGGGGGKQ
jgi:hypothetical protein